MYLDSYFNCICKSTNDNVWEPHRFLEIHPKGGLREDRRRQGEDQILRMPSATSFKEKSGLGHFHWETRVQLIGMLSHQLDCLGKKLHL